MRCAYLGSLPIGTQFKLFHPDSFAASLMGGTLNEGVWTRGKVLRINGLREQVIECVSDSGERMDIGDKAWVAPLTSPPPQE